MVNNSTSINKTNNHLSTPTFEKVVEGKIGGHFWTFIHHKHRDNKNDIVCYVHTARTTKMITNYVKKD